MNTPNTLHTSLLKPAVIHILRASGFHSTRPSVLDTVTDLAARHLLLVASRTAAHVHDRTIDHATDDPIDYPSDIDVACVQDVLVPTITDVRLGLTDAAFFTPIMTASEEAWVEALRRPLSTYPDGARDKERRRRDADDTRDVQDFVDWAMGPAAKEIRRIAGLLHEESSGPTTGATAAAVAVPTTARKEDYVATLKKKYGGKEPEVRFAETVLGERGDESRAVKIEGGPETLGDWARGVKRKRVEGVT